MKRIVIVVGVLAVLIGLVWMGQGSGLFPYPASSFMIDQSPWIVYGAAAVVAGIALIFAAWRR
jgi:hypothetical protein